MTASDGFGGRVSFTYNIDFPQPALNQPPVITAISEILRDDRNVVVKVDVVDPEGDEVRVDFEWGDGFELAIKRPSLPRISMQMMPTNMSFASWHRTAKVVKVKPCAMVFEPPVQNRHRFSWIRRSFHVMVVRYYSNPSHRPRRCCPSLSMAF